MSDPPNGSTMSYELAEIREVLGSKLTVPKLKHLLKTFGMTQSGNKPVLIERLLHYTQQLERDQRRSAVHEFFTELKKLQVFEGEVMSAPSTDRLNRQSYTQMVNSLTTEFTVPPGLSSRGTITYGNNQYSHGYSGPSPQLPNFKNSTMDGLTLSPSVLQFVPHAFYSLKSQLCRPMVLAGPYGRESYTRTLSFKIPATAIQDLRSKKCQIGLVAQHYFSPLQPQPVQFPMNCSIRADEHHVSANTRGVRNHPGSTPPVDVTPYVFGRSKTDLPHRVEVTVHINLHDPRKDDNMRSKAFAFAIVLLQQRTDDELQKELSERPHISAEATKEQISYNHRPDDDDDDDMIMTTDSVHSLKDPVMYTRIRTPIRSIRCSHIDCFDAETYIQLQRQATTWKCPVCNKVISWDSLAIDDYFNEILNTADQDVDQVNVSADGSWTVKSRDVPEDESDSEDDYPSKKSRKQVEVIDLVSDEEQAQPLPQALPTTLSPTLSQTLARTFNDPPTFRIPVQQTNEPGRLTSPFGPLQSTAASSAESETRLSAAQRNSLAMALDDDTDDELPVRRPQASQGSPNPLSVVLRLPPIENSSPAPPSEHSQPSSPDAPSLTLPTTLNLLSQIKRSREPTSGVTQNGIPAVPAEPPMPTPSASVSSESPKIRPRGLSMLFAPHESVAGPSSVTQPSVQSPPELNSSDEYIATKQHLDNACMPHMQRKSSRPIEVIDLIGDD